MQSKCSHENTKYRNGESAEFDKEQIKINRADTMLVAESLEVFFLKSKTGIKTFKSPQHHYSTSYWNLFIVQYNKQKKYHIYLERNWTSSIHR